MSTQILTMWPLEDTAITTHCLEERTTRMSTKRISMKMWMTTKRIFLSLFSLPETLFLSMPKQSETLLIPTTLLNSKTEQSQQLIESDLLLNRNLSRSKTRIFIKQLNNSEAILWNWWNEIILKNWENHKCKSLCLCEKMRLLQIQVKWQRQSLFDSCKERQWVLNQDIPRRVAQLLSHWAFSWIRRRRREKSLNMRSMTLRTS